MMCKNLSGMDESRRTTEIRHCEKPGDAINEGAAVVAIEVTGLKDSLR